MGLAATAAGPERCDPFAAAGPLRTSARGESVEIAGKEARFKLVRLEESWRQPISHGPTRSRAVGTHPPVTDLDSVPFPVATGPDGHPSRPGPCSGRRSPRRPYRFLCARRCPARYAALGNRGRFGGVAL